jgi:hypothetical protein
MRLFDRRSRLERLVDDTGIRSALDNVPASKATKAGVIAAAGVAALTAASARISSLRRRGEPDADAS